MSETRYLMSDLRHVRKVEVKPAAHHDKQTAKRIVAEVRNRDASLKRIVDQVAGR